MIGRDRRTVVGRFWREVFNRGDLDVADEIFTPDHVMHGPGFAEGPDDAGIKNVVVLLRSLSPNLRADVEDEVADADRVVSRWTASGTLAEGFEGRGRAGDRLTISGIAVFLISDGRIGETWMQLEIHRAASEVPAAGDEVWSRMSVEVQQQKNDEQARFICKVCPWLC